MNTALVSARDYLGRNQRRVAILVLLLVCVYFIVIFGEQAARANRLEAEIDQQRASIAAIRQENARLAVRAEQMNSPAYNAYVEQVARRDLGLARPGETVVIVPRQAAVSRATAEPPSEPEVRRQNWQLWIDAVFERDQP